MKKLEAVKLLALDVDGVLTDGTIYIGAEGELFKGFNAKDGMGISCALRSGIEVAIITGRTSEIIRRRTQELGIKTVLEGVHDKAAALAQLAKERSLEQDAIAYVGDDLNDLPAFSVAGLAFAPGDAAAEVIDTADIILEHAGGRGAVREAIEMILQAQGKWQDIVASYLHCGQGDKQ